MNGIQLWHLWVIAGLALAVLEIKLSGFVTLWFGIGAFAAAMVAALGLGPAAQLITFSALSIALFVLSRTLFQRFLMRSASGQHRQGTDAMLGHEAIVTESLPNDGYGTVRINGELWTARSLSGPMDVGSWVQVEQVEGLKLGVRPRASLGASPGAAHSRKETAE